MILTLITNALTNTAGSRSLYLLVTKQPPSIVAALLAKVNYKYNYTLTLITASTQNCKCYLKKPQYRIIYIKKGWWNALRWFIMRNFKANQEKPQSTGKRIHIFLKSICIFYIKKNSSSHINYYNSSFTSCFCKCNLQQHKACFLYVYINI